MDVGKERQISKMLTDFLDRRYAALKGVTLESLDINPFLLRLMSKTSGIEKAEDIIRWALDQRMERGTVTSFGMLIEGIAKVFSGKTKTAGADIVKEKGKKTYYIQVKSGPNTVNKDIASEITRLLEDATKGKPNSVGMLGMCYGKGERVSSIIRKYMGVQTIIGAKFWEFISEKPYTHNEIFSLMASVAMNHKLEDGRTYRQLYEEKVQMLTREFVKEYGKNGDAMWKKFFKKNM